MATSSFTKNFKINSKDTQSFTKSFLYTSKAQVDKKFVSQYSHPSKYGEQFQKMGSLKA